MPEDTHRRMLPDATSGHTGNTSVTPGATSGCIEKQSIHLEHLTKYGHIDTSGCSPVPGRRSSLWFCCSAQMLALRSEPARHGKSVLCLRGDQMSNKDIRTHTHTPGGRSSTGQLPRWPLWSHDRLTGNESSGQETAEGHWTACRWSPGEPETHQHTANIWKRTFLCNHM